MPLNVLIVHAHHEPHSFCSALFNRVALTLARSGHRVVTSDLYALRFDPVSDRRNFVSVFDPSYLKQGREEQHATAVGGFVPELEHEIRKLEECDLLVFSFPLWWFSMPAILKGWVDRTFAFWRIFGASKLYEQGLGHGSKRAMIMMTTGGPRESYGPPGPHPPIDTILTPIEHGIFRFNGFVVETPFIVFQPARMSTEERHAQLKRVEERFRRFDCGVAVNPGP